MFTEDEVALMLEKEEVDKSTEILKNEFTQAEIRYLEISNHDFLSLILLTPSVGIANANGSVSLFEEIALNKKARLLSKGGYFMKKDPVVVAMGVLIKKYSDWESKFLSFLKNVLENSVDLESISTQNLITGEEVDPQLYRKEILQTPYIFVRFFSSFFCAEDVDILDTENRTVSKVEYEKVQDLGMQLGIDNIPIFRHFCATYSVR